MQSQLRDDDCDGYDDATMEDNEESYVDEGGFAKHGVMIDTNFAQVPDMAVSRGHYQKACYRELTLEEPMGVPFEPLKCTHRATYDKGNREMLLAWIKNCLMKIWICEDVSGSAEENIAIMGIMFDDCLFRAYDILDDFMSKPGEAGETDVAGSDRKFFMSIGCAALTISVKWSKPGWQKLKVASHIAEYITMAIGDEEEGSTSAEEHARRFHDWLDCIRNWEWKILKSGDFNIIRPNIRRFLCYLQIESLKYIDVIAEQFRSKFTGQGLDVRSRALEEIRSRIGHAARTLSDFVVDGCARSEIVGECPSKIAFAVIIAALDNEGKFNLGVKRTPPKKSSKRFDRSAPFRLPLPCSTFGKSTGGAPPNTPAKRRSKARIPSALRAPPKESMEEILVVQIANHLAAYFNYSIAEAEAILKKETIKRILRPTGDTSYSSLADTSYSSPTRPSMRARSTSDLDEITGLDADMDMTSPAEGPIHYVG